MITVRCEVCGNIFQRTPDFSGTNNECKRCCLKDITGGLPPEEGDFNTAMLRSGEYTDEEYAALMQDLASVESGCTASEEDDYYYECRYCDSDPCICRDLIEDELDDEDDE